MNIFDRLFKRNRNRDPTSGLRVVTPALHTAGDYNLSGNEAIFSAVSRIATTFGAVPCHLYQDRKIVKDHPMERLLNVAPNHFQTPYFFHETMETCRNTSGNAYALVVPGLSGEVERLDVLDPKRVTPVLDTDTGELWYRLMPDFAACSSLFGQGEGGEFLVHNYHMIHTRHICSNGYQGISPIAVLRDSLEYDDEIKKFSLSQLKTGVHTPVMLEVPSQLSEEKKKAMVKSFMQVYQASSGGLILLDAGVKAERLQGSPVDSKVLDVERISKNRVAAVYGMPPHLLGDYGESSFRTNEQAMLEFISLTMLHIFEMYAQEYNKKLLTPAEQAAGFLFAFDMDKLQLADTATRGEYASKAIRAASKTPNEIREQNGDPWIEGGDDLMIARDLVPLSMIFELAKEYSGSLLKGGENVEESGTNDGSGNDGKNQSV